MPLTLRSLACSRFKREQDWREVTGGNVVMGRDLHEFLEVKKAYTTWFMSMAEYGFSAGQDFLPKKEEINGRGRPQQDHIISLDMAKEISMIQRTERGKQARQYFIECERRMKQLQPELTPEQLMAKALPCSKPYLTIRLKPVIMVVSFYKDLNQALSTRDKLGQCIDPRSRSRRPRGFA
ncbi:antA/AntB antirepressor family protein [Corynebacterium propinquum]|nr:antA/AntB antirepressor family protein [Corynebacterium propinquum]QQU90726.1 antA/AntB antirepressor family protein [Corynebacterium propinquum]